MKNLKIITLSVIAAFFMGGCAQPFLVGKEAFDKGDYKTAIPYFEAAAKENPDNGDYYRWLCVAYDRNVQYKETVDSCKMALKLPHVEKNEDESYTHLAHAKFKLGETGEAVDLQKKVLELTPQDENVFMLMAVYYNANKQHDEAITAAKRSIEIKPGAFAYTELGFAYEKKEKYAEAIFVFKKALALDPTYVKTYEHLGYCLEKRDKYTEAIQAYSDGIKNGGSLQQPLASLYYRLGYYDEAIVNATKAIEKETIQGIGLQSEIKDGFPIVISVTKNAPALKAGVKIGDRIVEIDGESTKEWDMNKLVQRLRGTAGTEVTIAIKEKDSNKKVVITRGVIVLKEAAKSMGLRSLAYRQKGDFEKALNDAKTAMNLGSSDSDVLLAFGAASLDRGEYNEAIQLLSQVKDSSTAVLLKATALAKSGRTEEAVRIYASMPAVDISQKNIPVTNDLQVLLQAFRPIVIIHRDKAKSFEEKNMNKEMLAELSVALQIADDADAQAIQEEIFNVVKKYPLLSSEVPDEARRHALRGEIFVKEGKFNQAVAEFKMAIRIAPYVARLYSNTALVCAEIKNYPEAIHNMNMYLKIAVNVDVRAAKDKIIEWELLMEKGDSYIEDDQKSSDTSQTIDSPSGRGLPSLRGR